MEKHRTVQSHIHSLFINQDKITDQDEFNKQIFSFNQPLFSRKVWFQTDKIETYLENIPLLIFSNEQALCCEGIISEDEVFKSLRNFMNASGMKSKILF